MVSREGLLKSGLSLSFSTLSDKSGSVEPHGISNPPVIVYEREVRCMPIKFSVERLHEERMAQDRTQIWLSDRAGLSIRYLRDLEKGKKKNPSAELLCRISSALEIEMEDLLVVCKGEGEQL